MDERQNKLKVLKEKTDTCTKCNLHSCRVSDVGSVFAKGNPETALILIVGETSTTGEAEVGKPIIGRVGELLDTTIKSLGYDLVKDIYIVNTLYCPTPDGRKPTDQELHACSSLFAEHLELISPKIILTLGNNPLKYITNTKFGIFKAIDMVFDVKFGENDYKVIPNFHPDFILEDGGFTSKHFLKFNSQIEKAFNLSKENQENV